MRAVRAHAYGGVDVLQFEEAPRPQPGAGEVLIRARAASVNPIDWKFRAGYLKDFVPVSFPFTPGRDVSGVVESVGSGVTKMKSGDEVYALTNGTYAEYVVAKETDVALKPKSIDHAQAAAIPLGALTAWQALFEKAKVARGQKVLIHAAAGGVGGFAAQLAKWKGAHVVGTGSNEATLRQLGVDQPIDYRKVRFDDAVTDVDAVLDTIGGETQQRSWKVLKRGGILISIVAPPSAEEAARVGARGELLLTHASGAQLTEIAQLVDAGHLKPVVASVLPLAEARRAQEISESGHAQGKIVLQIA
jgi:NADPH:quinone reductase-like Zn-dependent oxidoreductase